VAEVLIALGSNMGDCLANLQEAVWRLADTFEVQAVSSVYETEPMYVVDQPVFMNGAVLVEASIGPRQILNVLKRIELEIGRLQRRICGPREIDLDLIAFGGLVYRYFNQNTIALQVPHPRVGERRFVLVPLADVAPTFLLPGIGIVAELLAQTESQAENVKKVDHALLSIQRNQ